MARMDVTRLADRPADRLSGGELARVLIARALAQDAPLLLADEPAAGLDPAHQLSLMARLRDLAAAGRGVLVSLHDLGLAARWCDRLIALHDGVIAADGPPRAVLTPALLATVYGVRAHVSEGPGGLTVQALEAL
jgi:iron complex transport system ATP-binding protein